MTVTVHWYIFAATHNLVLYSKSVAMLNNVADDVVLGVQFVA